MTEYLSIVVKGAKATSAILLAVGIVYGTLYAAGVAPITNSQAKIMIIAVTEKQKAELQREILEFKQSVDGLRKSFDSLDDSVNIMQGTLERFDERSERTKELQDDILRELRRVN